MKEKSREEVIAEQRGDRSGLTRNRRMFGALLGTLQQFKQDETKLKDKVKQTYMNVKHRYTHALIHKIHSSGREKGPN